MGKRATFWGQFSIRDKYARRILLPRKVFAGYLIIISESTTNSEIHKYAVVAQNSKFINLALFTITHFFNN